MNYISPIAIAENIELESLSGTSVTLINMPIREHSLPTNAPLGLALLGARLQGYDVNVRIIDLNVYRVKEERLSADLEHGRFLNIGEIKALFERHFSKYGDTHLVGMSGLITTLRWQIDVAKIIRELQPNAILASGGGLATEFRDQLFPWIPELDAVAHSEGDDVILKMTLDAKNFHDLGLRNAMLSGKLDPYYIGDVNGRPRFSYDGGRPSDLDSIPFPAYDLIETDVDNFPVLETYLNAPIWGSNARNSSATTLTMKRSISTISSRGCPFACKFCFRGAQGERNYGIRSAENLAEEMYGYHEKYDVDFVGIVDDNFMVNRKRIHDLVPVLGPFCRETGVRWGTHGRLDEAADLRPDSKSGSPVFEETFRVSDMADAGCVYIGFGAESASPSVLEAMGKGGFILKNGTVNINGYNLPRTMIEGIRNSSKFGIHANCTWIMGYPGDTLEDIKHSLAFIQWQKDEASSKAGQSPENRSEARNAVNSAMFTATAYPGTEMFKHPIVQERLGKLFEIKIDEASGEPVADDALKNYILDLDDATKVLMSKDGAPLHYSTMTDDVFMSVRNSINEGKIEEVMDQ